MGSAGECQNMNVGILVQLSCFLDHAWVGGGEGGVGGGSKDKKEIIVFSLPTPLINSICSVTSYSHTFFLGCKRNNL